MGRKLANGLLLGLLVWEAVLPASARAEGRDGLKDLWPAVLPAPADLRSYRPAVWSQRTVITDGRDDHAAIHENTDDVYLNAPTVFNPNRAFPWRVSGGMDPRAKSWQSQKSISVPRDRHIRWWVERIEAGARRPLPRVAWEFPVGTVTADLLLYRGKPFELRTREKVKPGPDGWDAKILWEDPTNRPPDYKGPGTIYPKPGGGLDPLSQTSDGRPVPAGRCNGCHGRAGAYERYGTLLRGSDTVFSVPILKPGTLTPDVDNWPLKRQDEP